MVYSSGIAIPTYTNIYYVYISSWHSKSTDQWVFLRPAQPPAWHRQVGLCELQLESTNYGWLCIIFLFFPFSISKKLIIFRVDENLHS